MSFRNALLFGLGGFLLTITGLQLWLNPAREHSDSFRVGFLPVT